MSTNKIVLRSIEEVMNDYRPTYNPLYTIFLGNAQAYDEYAGDVKYKELTTIGDIRAKHYTPKDTEMSQISVGEASKVFRKYFLANQYIVSDIQSRDGDEQVVAQVLDEHQVQMDELFLFGDDLTGANIVNNGLFHSNDPNYNLRSSASVANATAQSDMHDRIMTAYNDIKDQDGRKVIIFYGSDSLKVFNSIYAQTSVAFKKVLGDVLDNVDFTEIPTKVTPSGVNGFIIVNLDRVKLNYVKLPELEDQDHNREKKYIWHNFLMGSCMLDVREKNAVTRQPLTFS